MPSSVNNAFVDLINENTGMKGYQSEVNCAFLFICYCQYNIPYLSAIVISFLSLDISKDHISSQASNSKI